MVDRDDLHPAPGEEAAAEDFLFHLHRGTELLQDNRVHAAKAELEHALALQPSDPKGQDLLGIVYFRLGLYPRAISIYELLIRSHPDAIEPRINLALCYLKTGQPTQARGELEKVVAQSPHHQRAWGYLGLACQRLGDFERASQAFAAGGHDAMARRLADMAGGGSGDKTPPGPPVQLAPPTPPTPPVQLAPVDAPVAMMSSAPAPAPMNPLEDEMRRAAGEAADVVDQSGFRRESDLPRLPSGTWSAIEPGREEPGARGSAISLRDPLEASLRQPPLASTPQPSMQPSMTSALELRATLGGPAPPPPPPPGFGPVRPPSQGAPSPAMLRPTGQYALSTLGGSELSPTSAISQPPMAVRGAALAQGAGEDAEHEPPPASAVPRSVPTPPSSVPGFAARAPDTPLAFARKRLLVFPRSLSISLHPSGLALVQAGRGFAARLDAIRSVTLGLGATAQALRRRSRGRDQDEPLGGPAAPIHELGGRCELVLSAPEGRSLSALQLGDEPLYLREDALLGFELSVTYENGRLPTGDGDAVPMVQLRGRGGVLCALPEGAAAIETVGDRATLVRAVSVIGWIGRLIPRALPPSEAPAGMRGLAAFSGEGMVIIDGH